MIIYPGSGTGAWEAAIVNTLSPGDRVLMFETGHFATLWRQMAARFGIEVEFVPAIGAAASIPPRSRPAVRGSRPVDQGRDGRPQRDLDRRDEPDRRDPPGDRRGGPPGPVLVDTISSLASVDVRHDEWGIDVTVSGSQKGLMLPPGLGFTAISEKARAAARHNTMPRSYWDWEEMLKANASGTFPYTPATNLLWGLREAIAMLREEGLDAVFARHARLAAATRAAVEAWGLEVLCQNPDEHSPVLTAVMMPEGRGADAFRAVALERFDLSLGAGLSKLSDKIFRIGHLGETNDLTLMGALSGVEMALAASRVPHRSAACSPRWRAWGPASTADRSPRFGKAVHPIRPWGGCPKNRRKPPMITIPRRVTARAWCCSCSA